jgi:hypothetical protein
MPVNKKFRKKIQNALDNTALRSALDYFAQSYPPQKRDRQKIIWTPGKKLLRNA